MSYSQSYSPMECLLSFDSELSIESITVASGVAAFYAGMVLGSTLTSGSATATAFSTNTGNGAMGTITVTGPAKIGTYNLIIVEPDSDVGNFVVIDPDGICIGKGTVASAFSVGGLAFTLADGATDFVAGDGFTIKVSGTYKYVQYDDGNTDGSNIARAVALEACDASSADVAIRAAVRLAAVKKDNLVWNSSVDSTAKAKAYSDLAKYNIFAK